MRIQYLIFKLLASVISNFKRQTFFFVFLDLETSVLNLTSLHLEALQYIHFQKSADRFLTQVDEKKFYVK